MKTQRGESLEGMCEGNVPLCFFARELHEKIDSTLTSVHHNKHEASRQPVSLAWKEWETNKGNKICPPAPLKLTKQHIAYLISLIPAKTKGKTNNSPF